ncbi:MAG: ankyrin repeat domain-containing protein, partial [Alphaproteobacteria bacterium]|nr:ankyrin repeat domain-containing protein [Alphaproteobacteria bacterium]
MHTKLALLSTISIMSISTAFSSQYESSYSNNSNNNNQQYTSNKSEINSINNNQKYSGENPSPNTNPSQNTQSVNTQSVNAHSPASPVTKEILQDLENEYYKGNKAKIREIIISKQKEIVASERAIKHALFLAATYGFYMPMNNIFQDPNLKYKPGEHAVNKLLSQTANGRVGATKYLLGLPVPGPQEANKTLTAPTWLPLPNQDGVNKAFSTAARGGYLSIMDILIQHQKLPAPNQDSVDDAFFMAAGGGHIDVLKWLFTPHNGLPNNKSLPLPSQAGAKRALIWAAQEGHTKVVEFLFSPHENISLPDQQQINHALQTAASHGKRKVVEYIMTQHAGVPLPDQTGVLNAFKTAATEGHIHLMEYLLTPRMGVSLPDQASIAKIYDAVQNTEESKKSPRRKETLEFLRKRVRPPQAISTVTTTATPAAAAPIAAPIVAPTT